MKDCKNLFLFMDENFSNFISYILISEVTSSCDISKEIKHIFMYKNFLIERSVSKMII